MGGGVVRRVGWLLLGAAALAAGAVAGFAVSLIRPRHYADFAAARPHEAPRQVHLHLH